MQKILNNHIKMENDKQQIGGYFSSTNASKDEALRGMVAARISSSEDIQDDTYTVTTNLVRIATDEGCRVSLQNTTKRTRSVPVGMLLPAGNVEYFSVTPNSVIVITGTANVSSIE